MTGRTVGTTTSKSTAVADTRSIRTNWAPWAKTRKRFQRRSERARSGAMAGGAVELVAVAAVSVMWVPSG